jgi:hypothetical protein
MAARWQQNVASEFRNESKRNPRHELQREANKKLPFELKASLSSQSLAFKYFPTALDLKVNGKGGRWKVLGM